MSPIAFFDTIHESHYTILAIFFSFIYSAFSKEISVLAE